MDTKKASKYLSDFIKIGENILRKSKINFVGIVRETVDRDKSIFMVVEKSNGKSIKIQFESHDHAMEEFQRIEKELDKTAFSREISDFEISLLPKEYLKRLAIAKSDEEILSIFREHENYVIYKNAEDQKNKKGIPS